MFLLSIFLKKIIRKGTLNIIDASGALHTFQGAPGPEVTIRFHDHKLPWQLFWRVELKTGEAYMDGTLTVEDGGDIYDLIYLVTKNLEWRADNPLHETGGDPITRFKTWFSQLNAIARSKQNVAHHYDLSGDLYDLFLDKDRQYSCAFFKKPTDTLEQAQENKKALIVKKLLLKKGQKVLDIGSGWGGLGLYIHKKSGVEVTGITLSEEQLKLARAKAKKEKVGAAVVFRLQDYREVRERFERIVSVGMFEHVGRKNYRNFFRKISSALKDDGIALIHTIGRADGPGATDPWTTKYIFPGGYTPSLSELAPVIEKAGLYITDIEVWRLHYAETLKEWRKRTYKNRVKIEKIYDKRFFRMWDFYLASSECAFRNLGHVVFQIQLAKKINSVPLTRDYMTRK